MTVDVLSDRGSARERAYPVIRRERLAISNRRQIVGPVPDTFGIVTKNELSADHLDPGSSDWREDILKPGFVGLAISSGGIRSATFALGLEQENIPFGTSRPRDRQDRSPWQGIFRHLREHGNLICPGGGITHFSGAAVVLRGSLLNLIVWLPILAGFFILAFPFSTILNWLGAGVAGAIVTVCILNSLGTGSSR